MTDSQALAVAMQALGAALLHSVWQGLLIAGVAAVLLGALRGGSAKARYAVACVALAVMVGAWAITAVRTAVDLGSQAAAPAVAAVAAPPVLLGPGPLDFSPAIRPLASGALMTAAEPSWPARLERWSAAAVPIWLVGVVVLSIRLTVSWLIVERLRRVALGPVSAELAAHVTTLAARVRVSRAVRIAQSAAVQVPAVVGWLRPIILLPASTLTGLAPAQLDAVIAHELAHVRRHDFAVNLLQTAAEILLFHHPASWWISQRIRAEREHCCDDIAVTVCGDRLTYATALADLEALRHRPTLALAATDGPLLQRVRRLIAPAPTDRGSQGWVALAVPLCAIALVLGSATLTRVAAQTVSEQSKVPGASRSLPADLGVVRGRVLDAQSGRPIEGARVGVEGTNDSVSAVTDENGAYETKPMKPGSYGVAVNASGYALGFYGQDPGTPFNSATTIDVRGGRITLGVDVRLQAIGRVNGRILDDQGRGLPGVEIELVSTRGLPGLAQLPRVAFAQTEAGGVYRLSAAPGDYTVRAYVGNASIRPSKDTALAYTSTFYPGVRAMEDAQRLRVDAGLDLYDIDFTLVSSRLLHISGTVVDPLSNDLKAVRVSVRSIGADSTSREFSVAINATGEFDVTDILPGTYMVTVWDQANPSRWVGSMKHLVVEDDVAGLEFRAESAASVVGRVVRDSRSLGRLDLDEVRIGFEKRMGDGPGMMSGFLLASNGSASNGSFIGSVPGGPLMLTAYSLPEGWAVKSIRLDNADVFGQPVDLSPGRHDVEVVLTDRLTTLGGLVVDRRGTPLGGYDVVLFPEDVTKWHPASPLILWERSHKDGQFQIGSVPPGDYLAVAVDRLPFRAWTNPDVLRRLQSLATRLTVREGEHKTISIRASPTPEGIIDVL